jgi:hypothetical protein
MESGKNHVLQSYVNFCGGGNGIENREKQRRGENLRIFVFDKCIGDD